MITHNENPSTTDSARGSAPTTPPKRTRHGRRAVRFLTKPELTVVDGRVVVKFDLVNAGPTRVGLRFDIDIENSTFVIDQPTLTLSAGSQPTSIRLDVALQADPTAKVTVTVKGAGGESLAVGSNGIKVAYKGASGVRVAAGTNGVTVGWAALVAGTALSIGAIYAVTRPTPEPTPEPEVALDDEVAVVEEEIPVRTEPPAVSREIVSISLPASVELSASQPVEDGTWYPFGEPVPIVIALDVRREATPTEAAGIGAVDAAVVSLTADFGDEVASLGEHVLPTGYDAGVSLPRVPLIEVPISVVPIGLASHAFCFPENDQSVSIGGWRTTGEDGQLSLGLYLFETETGAPEIAVAATLSAPVVYERLGTPTAVGADIDHANCEAIDDVEVWWDSAAPVVATGDPADADKDAGDKIDESVPSIADESTADEPDGEDTSAGSPIGNDAPDGWSGDYSAEPASGPLAIGDRGSRVEALQSQLVDIGLLDPAGVDGDFGPQTWNAVRAFQANEGLEVDGIAGPQTLEAIATTAE